MYARIVKLQVLNYKKKQVVKSTHDFIYKL